jgi:hypothetical protein
MRGKLALITAATAMLAISTTASIARPMGGGMHAGGMHMGGVHMGGIRMGRVGGVGFRGAAFPVRHPFARPFFHPRHVFFRPYFAGFYGASCWRWQLTPVGWRRIWACGYPYAYSSYYPY